MPPYTRKRKKGDPPLPPPEPDGQTHVARIMDPDPLLFSPKLKLAIEFYLDTSPRDIVKAAERAGMNPSEFRKHMQSSPGVRQYVSNLEEKIDAAYAESCGKARALHATFLDEHLVVAVKAGSAEGDTDALELGYERIGLRRDKNFMTQQQANPQSRPQIYRVLEQTVTRTEQVTQREITTSDHPRQIERASNLEILDY